MGKITKERRKYPNGLRLCSVARVTFTSHARRYVLRMIVRKETETWSFAEFNCGN